MCGFLVVGSHGVPFGWESGEQLEPTTLFFCGEAESIGAVPLAQFHCAHFA